MLPHHLALGPYQLISFSLSFNFSLDTITVHKFFKLYLPKKILKKKYPNKIEIIIDGNLPLKEYLKVISRANIIVDQASTYSYGMNALYSMAQGKIVMTGLEKEALSAFGLSSSPVINIKPCVNNIVMEIEKILQDLSLVEKIGKETRDFVVNHHDYKKIARMYMDTWHPKGY